MSDDSDINHRYDRWYELSKTVRFHLSSYTPNEQEARYLLLKVVEQAINDYCSLENSDIPYANLFWESARDFLFDDRYWIYWGDLELSLEDILDIIEVDIDWVRDTARKKYRKKQNDRPIRGKTETT